MKRARILIILGVLAVIGLVIYTSMGTQGFSCEVCMEFNDRTQCRSAAGDTRQEAIRTATTAACATLAGGMAESIRCENTPPQSVTCRER